MTIVGFDYKTFAKSMSEQANEIAAEGIDDYKKEYLVAIIYEFVLKAGDSLYNDEKFNIDSETAYFICQLLAEWTYHKAIDLMRAEIPSQYWNFVMEKIAFAIFESAKSGVRENLEQQMLIDLTEHHAVKAYQKAIAELNESGKISDDLLKKAYNQSNVDTMYQEKPNSKTNGFWKHNIIRMLCLLSIIIKGCTRHVSLQNLVNIDKYSTILFAALILVLTIIIYYRNNFNFNNIFKIKKYIIELSLIMATACLSVNILKIILGYPHGVLGTLIAVLFYIGAQSVQIAIEQEEV